MSDDLKREFAEDITNRLARLEIAGMMPEAVAIREGVLPQVREWGHYPVVRLAPASPLPWGVIA